MFPSHEIFKLLGCSSSVCEVVFFLVLLPMCFSLWEEVFLLNFLHVRLSSSAYDLSSYEAVFVWGCLRVRLSSCEVVFVWDCLLVRSSSCGIIFLLLFMSYSWPVVFLWGHPPVWLRSCEVVFLWGFQLLEEILTFPGGRVGWVAGWLAAL